MARRDELEQAITALEQQRTVLGAAVVDTALASLRAALNELGGPSPQSHGQRKQVSVLFADISGFTALSERMDVEDVNDLMNTLWLRLDRIILEHNGHIDKHMGDAVMSIWGVDVARENDAEQAIRTALAIQNEIQAFNQDREDMPSLHMRIGIHTGPVLLGEVGATSEYTAIGDTVNIASYLEHVAPVGGILVSHDTFRHVRGLFYVRPLDPICAKGRKQPVAVYLVQKAKPRPFHNPSRGVEGIETRMVGRCADLERLRQAFATVTDRRQMQVVTIVGEAGLGKSRLLSDFRNWLDLQPMKVRIFLGRARQETSDVPYALLRDLFNFRFDIQERADADVVQRKFEEGVRLLMGPDATQHAHFIGQLIGLDFSHSPYLRGFRNDPRQMRDRAFHSIRQFFSIVASNGPAAIYLEDIHWADKDSLDLFEHLSRTCANLPLLLIGLTRPTLFDRRPHWEQGERNHTRIELQRLTTQESHQLIREILCYAPHIPDALSRIVTDVAEGIPFYIEEMIKMLIEDGVIVKGVERWQIRMAQLANVHIPPTLTAIVQTRLDSLPPVERAILNRASIVGRTFWADSVAQCAGCPQDEAERQAALAALCRHELIIRNLHSTFAGSTEYVFAHALVQQGAHETLLKRDRRQGHAQVARWMVDKIRRGQQSDEHSYWAGMIAHHFEEAQMWSEAIDWYSRAGRQAQQAYAPQAAIEYFQKVLDFTQQQQNNVAAPQQIEWCERLGDMLFTQARYEEAIQAYQQMHHLAETIDHCSAQARALVNIAWINDLQGDHQASLQYAIQAEAVGTGVDRIHAICRRAWAYFRLGEAQRALRTGEEALQLCDQMGAASDRERAECLHLLAAAYVSLGDSRMAAHYDTEALAIYRTIGDRRGEIITLNNLGESARLQGDYTTAVARYQESLDICREIGHEAGEAILNSNLGAARLGLDDYAGAETNLRQAISAAGATHFTLAETYSFLAEACLRQGKHAESEDAVRRALDLAYEQQSPLMLGQAWRALGMLLADTVPPRAFTVAPSDSPISCPAACFAKSHDIFQQSDMIGEQARTLRAWAVYLFAHKKCRQAEARWQSARRLFASIGAEWEVRRMDAWQAIGVASETPVTPAPGKPTVFLTPAAYEKTRQAAPALSSRVYPLRSD